MELRDTFSDKNNINGLIQVFQKAIQDSEKRTWRNGTCTWNRGNGGILNEGSPRIYHG